MMKWLRENNYAAVVLTVIRIYIGYEWMIAGWHKITGEKAFNATGFLNGAIAKPVLETGTTDAMYPNYIAFLENFALPNVKLVNILIPWGEFLVGIGLLLGALTTLAVFFGLMLNFMFMFAGTVSSNPWMVLISFFVIAAGANAGKFGADYYIIPFIRNLFKKFFHPKNHTKTNAHTNLGVN